MANKYRNEVELNVGQEKILLRPTFENIAEMETNVGGVVYLAWKFGRSSSSSSVSDQMKSMPSFSEMAKIIYYNQAERDESGKRKFSLEQIWDLIHNNAMDYLKPVMGYLSVVMAGNKNLTVDDAEKKS